jgi:replicative DNA helicase
MHKEQAVVQVSPERILGKGLPCNVEAERAVLGALLLNDTRIAEIAELIVAHDFYAPAHRTIYQAMLDLVQRKQRIDLITLQDELEKSGSLSASGGASYLIGLQEDIPSLGMLEQHARLIKEKATLRELINSATTIIANCYAQNEKGIEAVVDEAEKTIFTISARRSPQHFVQLNIWLKRAFTTLSEMRANARGITGVPSGYQSLDTISSGFQNGDLIVLAARPSMGKTALALSLATHAARLGNTIGFFSLEMSAEQLTLRMLSNISGVWHQKIRNATVDSEEWLRLTTAAALMADLRVFIDDTALQSIMDVRAKARRLKQEHGLQLLLVDYLQLIHSTRKHENRHQEVSEISRSLKALAKELNIPVIALSQLSRAVDSRVDKRPLLSDLRESGAIEQDADLIMFLYRDSVYNPQNRDSVYNPQQNQQSEPDPAELIIGKQRNGPTGTVNLAYRRECALFEEGSTS